MATMVDIKFSRQELASELLAMQDEITTGLADSESVSLVALAISQFDMVVDNDVSEGSIDEVQAIGFEDFRKGIADAVYEAAKSQMGNTPVINMLNIHRVTPRADAKRHAEKMALETERKANAGRMIEKIMAVEAKHAVTSQVLRQNWYNDPTVEPHKRNGAWLAHKVEEITDNGSNIAVFTEQEAKILTGNALTKKSSADILRLKQDIGRLAKLHEQAKFLGARIEPGLFSGISKLQELAETDVLERRPDLKEIKSFIEQLLTPTPDLFERTVRSLDEGPFANCPELETLPFPANSSEDGKRSLKEIPTDDVNKENIRDDMQNAINASGSAEVIEEERIIEFISLKEHLELKYPGHIKIYRSLKSNWHPLPWYVIEIAQPNDPPLAVLESPLYGNATYYINNGDWPDTINFKRTDAQQLGAKPIPHVIAEGQTLVMHTNRIKATIKEGYRS